MRNLRTVVLILFASCVPPEHPDYAGAETAYERSDTRKVVRSVLEKQFGIESDDGTQIVTAWKPLYDKDEDVHYRLRVAARIVGAGPYRIDLRMQREDKDFVSGRWKASVVDDERVDALRKDFHRALGR